MRINRSIISNQTESVPVVRTLTINGVTYDLTANRSWTVSGGGITGSGTTNYLSKWTSGSALGNSTIYETSGNIIIGNTANRLRLTVSGLDSSSPTLGTASGTMLLCNSTSTNDYGMMFGISPTGSGWIQQQRVDASATAYALLLQPSGGNLIVGSTFDNATKFQVNGGIYGKGITSDSDGTTGNAIYAHNQVLTGSSNNALVQLAATWNTTGNPNAIELNVTNTASGSSAKLMNLQVGSVTKFNVSKGGAIQTAEPTGYTAKPWKLGDATSGTITPDYYIKVEIDGQIYSIPALLGTP